MSWYMYEPRSKIDDYDEGNDENQSFWGISDILMLPLMVIGMFCLELFFVLGLFFYYLSDVYKTTKATIITGEISYPFLAQVGIFVFLYLLWAFLSPSSKNEIPLSPATLIASVFVFNHTVLPYAALFLHKLKRFFGTEIA